MLETNFRIVIPGASLFLDTRCAEVVTQHPSPDLFQRVCNALQQRGLAAVPCPRSTALLVATQEPVLPLCLEGDDWYVEVKDGGQARRLQFAIPGDVSFLAQLLERCLLITIAQRPNYWKLNNRPRTWYEATPFETVEESLRTDDFMSLLCQLRLLA